MSQMDLDNFRESVRDNIGLDSMTASTIDRTLTDRWVNDGLEEIVMRARLNQDIGTIALSNGTWEYAFTPDFGSGAETPLDVLNIRTQGTGTARLVERVDVDELLNMRTATPSTNSPVTHYATMGYDRLLVYPTPSQAETLDVLAVKAPTAMSADGATPDEIPSNFHYVLENYVLWKAASFDDDSTSGFGQQYQLEFERGLRRLSTAISRRGDRRLGKARVGNRYKAIRHPNNDVYPAY